MTHWPLSLNDPDGTLRGAIYQCTHDAVTPDPQYDPLVTHGVYTQRGLHT